MFRIKICGITNVDDARMVAAAGADAIGLNFYPHSPRYVTPRMAAEIVALLPPSVVKVGVFVNAAAAHIAVAARLVRLDLVQLHGDEPPEFLHALAAFPGCEVMRAFRPGPAGLPPVEEYLERCRQLECLPELVMIDSHIQGVYGGTGKIADWTTLRGYPAEDWQPPMVLAGGLKPDNVAEAIRAVRPAAVDTASGVESSPGRKDRTAVAAFVAAARQAFSEVY